MLIVYIVMIVAGLALICWGLPAAYRLKKPFDIVAALAVLAGVVLSILGVLLFVDPGFFQG